MMLRVAVVLCMVGAALSGPPVSRSRSEIEKFRDFLESTRTDDGVVLGQRMAENPDSSVWENSGKYQGDILLDDEEVESMIDQYASGRNAYIRPNTLWPGRTVVYEFAAGHFDAAQRNYILYTISVLQSRTCIRFRPRNPGEFNFVRLTTNPTGCYASVGFGASRGVHTMNLARAAPGRGCFHRIVIIHEWLHVIGFFHMQSTHDRDNFVRINWGNIVRGMEHNFYRYGPNIVSNLGLPYEYDSCMHYGPRAFSSNGRTTIDALRAHPGVMGQMSYVTGHDFWRVDRHYRCVAWRTEKDYQPFGLDDKDEFPGEEFVEEEVARGEFTEEEIAKEEFVEEEVAREEFTEEEIAKEEIVEEEVARKEIVEEDVAEEMIANENILDDTEKKHFSNQEI